MELTFSQSNKVWVAEFEVTGDFNLHIEKGWGAMNVMQTTVPGGRYDNVKSLYVGVEDGVLDADVTALVYPKYIRIESRTEKAPYAIVSSEGDVTTIENVLNTPI